MLLQPAHFSQTGVMFGQQVVCVPGYCQMVTKIKITGNSSFSGVQGKVAFMTEDGKFCADVHHVFLILDYFLCL